jgi:hypothetical protein
MKHLYFILIMLALACNPAFSQVLSTGSWTEIGDVDLTIVTDDADNTDGVGDNAIYVDGKSAVVGQGVSHTFNGVMTLSEAITINTYTYNRNSSYVRFVIDLYNITDGTVLATTANIVISNSSSTPVLTTLSYTALASDVGDTLQIRYIRNDNGNTARNFVIDNLTLNGTFVSTSLEPPSPCRDLSTSMGDSCDFDGDGIVNYTDIDDDNDGITDANECTGTLAGSIGGNGTSYTWDGATASTVSVTTNATLSTTSSSITINTVGGVSRSAADDNRLNRTGDISLVFNFSPAVPANEIALYINDVNVGTPTFTFTVTGDATISDFSMQQANSQTVLSYDNLTGAITRTTAGRDHGVLVGRQADLISQISLVSSGAATDFIAYNLFSVDYCDDDGDGMPNQFDTDSDDDGCPDMLEGSGEFSLTSFTGGVSATGLPTGVGSGQAIGSSQNSSVLSKSCDFDEDGILNDLDLDDDNDGILDSVECAGTETLEYLGGSMTSTGYSWDPKSGVTSGMEFSSSPFSHNGMSIYKDAREAEVLSNTVNATFFQDGQGIDGVLGTLDVSTDMASYTTTTNSIITTNVIRMADFDADTMAFTIELWAESGKITDTADLNITTTGDATLSSAVDLGSGVFSFDFNNATDHHNSSITFSSNGDDNLIRIRFILLVNPNFAGDRISFDNIRVNNACIDTDNDGIANYLDSDSDNDGCPDALEGDSSFSLSILSNEILSGAVSTRGIPILVDSTSGQGIGSSIDATLKSDQCVIVSTIIDHNTIFEDSTATGNVVINDNGVAMRITAIDGTGISSTGSTITTDKGGSLTIDSTGEYNYIPSSSFIGVDSILYTVCNDRIPQQCLDEYLLIEVLSLSNPSDTLSNAIIGNGDKILTYGDTVSINLLTNDADPEWDNLIFSGIEIPGSPGTYLSSGTLTTLEGIDTAGNTITDAGNLVIASDGSVAFVPETGFVGDIILTYQVCDDGTPQACTQELLKIQVLDTVGSASSTVDNAPFANGDFSATDINTPVTGNFIGNDGNTDSADALSANGVVINTSGPASSIDTLTTKEGGTVVLNSDGTYLYTPPTDFSGTDNVVYEVCDTSEVVQCTQAAINFLVAPVVRDYTDLPSTWGERFSRYLAGPANTASGNVAYWLGSNLTSEGTSNANLLATGDGADDGLIIPSTLDSTVTNTFQVIVNGNQTGTIVYFKLNIDWDNDGVFEDEYTGSGVTDGPDTIDVIVAVPSGYTPTFSIINYRLVAQIDEDNLDNINLGGGEIEDYHVENIVWLPVELLDFKAEWFEKNKALLTWSTASELNNVGFEIFRSVNNGEYSKIGFVEGAGNSSSLTNYDFVDRDVTGFNICYKLKQIDYDGDLKWTSVECLSTRDQEESFKLYPNPAKGIIKIHLSNSSKSHSYRVVNLLGTEVLSGVTYSDQPISIDGLRKGIYNVEVSKSNSVKAAWRLVIL